MLSLNSKLRLAVALVGVMTFSGMASAEDVKSVGLEVNANSKFSELRLKFEDGDIVAEKPDGQKYKKCDLTVDKKPKCPGFDVGKVTDISTVTIVDYSYNPDCQMVSIGDAYYYVCY